MNALPPEHPMTKKGYAALENELKTLITIEREKVKHALAEARALGDLKENADYHAAKEKQSLIEGRIMEVQGKLARAKVIDTDRLPKDVVVFGSTVTVLNLEKDVEQKYTIVGEDEASASDGTISISAPLAKAMISKKVGDDFTVKAPKGDIRYEIVSIETN